MTHEPLSPKIYLRIFGALLFFTALTVAVTFIEMGRFNLVVALLIACTKASLVVLFFMDVKRGSSLTKLFVVSGIFWMMIMIGLTFSDYLSRDWLPVPQAWQ